MRNADDRLLSPKTNRKTKKPFLDIPSLKIFQNIKRLYILYNHTSIPTIPTIKLNIRRCITLFWKKKEIKEQKQENEHEVYNNFSVCDTPILKRKTRHAKTIIDNKLYDTEKAKFISPTADNRILFVTKKGNYFSCDTNDYEYTEREENEIFNIFETVYHDITRDVRICNVKHRKISTRKIHRIVR